MVTVSVIKLFMVLFTFGLCFLAISVQSLRFRSILKKKTTVFALHGFAKKELDELSSITHIPWADSYRRCLMLPHSRMLLRCRNLSYGLRFGTKVIIKRDPHSTKRMIPDPKIIVITSTADLEKTLASLT